MILYFLEKYLSTLLYCSEVDSIPFSVILMTNQQNFQVEKFFFNFLRRKFDFRIVSGVSQNQNISDSQSDGNLE